MPIRVRGTRNSHKTQIEQQRVYETDFQDADSQRAWHRLTPEQQDKILEKKLRQSYKMRMIQKGGHKYHYQRQLGPLWFKWQQDANAHNEATIILFTPYKHKQHRFRMNYRELTNMMKYCLHSDEIQVSTIEIKMDDPKQWKNDETKMIKEWEMAEARADKEAIEEYKAERKKELRKKG